MDNIEIFKLSLLHKENILDDYYIKEKIILNDIYKKQKKIIIENKKLIEYISKYSNILNNNNNNYEKNIIIENIITILKIKDINNTPFVIYWKIYDISHSIYIKMELDEKKDFLKYILVKYIENRHGLYLEHGYSDIVLQSNLDTSASRRGGQLGNKKIGDILYTYGLNFINSNNIETEDLLNLNNFFINADGDGKEIFKKIIKDLGLELKWMKNHQNKFPDCLIKIGNNIIIIEHKHLKEVGGTQYKQMTEIIELIKEKPNINNIYLVGFIDGVYLNTFIKEKIEPKLTNQRNDIYLSLSSIPTNYIVNTYGFKKLIESFIFSS